MNEQAVCNGEIIESSSSLPRQEGHPNLIHWPKGRTGNPKGRPPSVERQLKRALRHGKDREIAQNAIAIASDVSNPLCLAAIKWIADRIDGPLERAIRHTLDVPAVTLNVQLTAPRSMPALPEARTIDLEPSHARKQAEASIGPVGQQQIQAPQP